MEFKFRPKFFFIIVLFIVGSALFREFNSETQRFEKPLLAFIYGIVFLVVLFATFFRKKKE